VAKKWRTEVSAAQVVRSETVPPGRVVDGMVGDRGLIVDHYQGGGRSVRPVSGGTMRQAR